MTIENSQSIKGAEYAAQAVAVLAHGNPNSGARKAMAKAALSHGHYTQEGLAVWQDYLARGCPAA